jgi:hypothetical protein
VAAEVTERVSASKQATQKYDMESEAQEAKQYGN